MDISAIDALRRGLDLKVSLVSTSLMPVTIDDAPLIAAAASSVSEPISDCSVAATVAWAGSLELHWNLCEGHVCLFSAADNDLSMMLPPLPIHRTFEPRLPAALEACFELMDRVNAAGPGVGRSRIEYVSDERLDLIRSMRTIPLSATPMHADYVYPRAALVSLDGGPLKNKRKLRGRFLSQNQSVRTASITRDDVPECIDLLERWRVHADQRHDGEANDQLVGVDVLRLRDKSSTISYLENIDRLRLESMTVRVGRRLVGFTIGERLTPTMAVVTVEKTDPDYPGAPQFIYSEFCRTRYANCDEINAGDDWGISTLRASKQSYRPSRMLAKNVLTRSSSPGEGQFETATVHMLTHRPGSHNSRAVADHHLSVRAATIDDIPAMIAVENAAFADPEDRFNPRQIRRLIANPRARVAVTEVRGAVVAWAVALIRQHVRWQSGRVYSVAVHPDMAGRGIGRALLERSLQSLAEIGIGRVYLEVRATNRNAIRLYEEAGFKIVEHLPSYYGRGEDGLRMRRIDLSLAR